MKKMRFLLLLVLLLVPAMAFAGADIKDETLPGSLREYFSADSFNGYTIGENASRIFDNTGKGDFYFVAATSEKQNVLYVFKLSADGNNWDLVLKTSNAIPQGKGFFQMNAYYQGAVRFEGRSGYNIPLGAVVDIGWVVPDNEEIWSRTISLVLRNDGHWYVFHVGTPGQNYPLAYIYNNKVIYCDDNCVPKDSVSGIIENDLRYFSLSAFPKTPDKARETLSIPPEIPEGELEAESIKFTGGKKYSVYSGPGENYLRSGNGKAAVSTNDWIQVFGKENGWILIQYDISSDHMRFGYIKEKALPKKTDVKDLNFRNTAKDAVTATVAALTDDPLYSQTKLLDIPEGTPVRWLSSMGDWAYIEYEGKDKVRGFVSVSSLTTEITVDGMKITDAAAAASYLKGRAWLFEAGGNMTYECLLFRPEGPDEGKVQGCWLDDDGTYSFDQLIADLHNPAWYKEVKTGTWTVESCDGTEGFWNKPYLKLLLTFDGSTKAYGLTMEFHEHYQPLDSETTYEGLYTFSLTGGEGSGGWVECPDVTVPNENGTVG